MRVVVNKPDPRRSVALESETGFCPVEFRRENPNGWVLATEGTHLYVDAKTMREFADAVLKALQ